jgi:hypothetical protein
MIRKQASHENKLEDAKKNPTITKHTEASQLDYKGLQTFKSPI